MSDYLNSLVARTLRLSPVVRPRPASVFEPVSNAGGPEGAPYVETKSMLGDSQSAELADQVSTIRLPTQASQVPVTVGLPDGLKDPMTAIPEAGGSVDQPPISIHQPPTLVPAAPALDQVAPQSTLSVTHLETTRMLTHEAHRHIYREGPPHYPNTSEINSSSESENDQILVGKEPEVRHDAAVRSRQIVEPTLITPKPLPVTVQAAKQPTSPAQRFGSEASVPTMETVVVTIGRVDVRAVFQPPAAAPRSNRPQQPAPMSLDEYLKKRSEGHG